MYHVTLSVYRVPVSVCRVPVSREGEQLKLTMETDVERKARLEKVVAAQVGPGDGGRKKSKKRNEFN